MLDEFEAARMSAHLYPEPPGRIAAAGPYLPVGVVTVFLSGKVASGTTLTPVEAVGAASIFLLVATRAAMVFAGARPARAAVAARPAQ